MYTIKLNGKGSYLYDVALFMNELTGRLTWYLGNRSKLIVLNVSSNQVNRCSEKFNLDIS
jgi:hypothetical protein